MDGENQTPANPTVNDDVNDTSNVASEPGNVDNSNVQVDNNLSIDPTDNLRDSLTGKQPDKSFLPEEYRNKGWAKNIKTKNDIYKAYDNAQNLIGKKTIGVPSEDATPEELKSFYEKTTPKEYNIEGLTENKEVFHEMFKENGLTNKQANGIVEKYNSLVEEQNKMLFDGEKLKERLQERFGNDYQKTVDKTKHLLKQNIKESDYEAFKKLPNESLLIMLEYANNINKEYGVDNNNRTIANTTTNASSFEETVLQRNKCAENLQNSLNFEDENRYLNQLISIDHKLSKFNNK